jgi:predicted phosphodiesterase
MTFRIGIISDTHGLLRPEAERRLAGVDHIIHGGDIGRHDIIAALRRIAPVTAIKVSGPINSESIKLLISLPAPKIRESRNQGTESRFGSNPKNRESIRESRCILRFISRERH